MHTFDRFITKYVGKFIKEIYDKDDKSRKTRKTNQDEKLIKKISAQKKQKDVEYSRKEIREKSSEQLKEIKKLLNYKLNINSANHIKTKRRYNYVRYASDWVLISNCSESYMEKIKTTYQEC